MKRLNNPIFLCLVIIALSACNTSDIPCYCVMETMKGEWRWIKTYTPKHGVIDNAFESKLKVLDQNEDFSISYEFFVDDTLFYSGNFQFRQENWMVNGNVANIKLPHYDFSGGWGIYYGDMLTGTLSEDTLTFWGGDIDGYFYYYEKIRKE